MAELPEDLLDDVEALTRRARRAADDAEADAYRRRRDELLAEHGFTARVREGEEPAPGPGRESPSGEGAVLVCHPEEWVVDGDVHPDRIDDLDRAVELPLEGSGDPDEWAAVDEANRAVAAAVREAHGDVHGDNAEAFAAFMSNHYAKRLERATPEEVEEFLEDYYVRNVWPSDEQAAVVEESVERALAVAREEA